MVPRKSGLIVNVSSAGGLLYLFNCAYGIGKAGCDRMAADCGTELKKHNVAMISLWPGPVKTENITELILGNKQIANDIGIVCHVTHDYFNYCYVSLLFYSQDLLT